jgi:hypothetical protein
MIKAVLGWFTGMRFFVTVSIGDKEVCSHVGTAVSGMADVIISGYSNGSIKLQRILFLDISDLWIESNDMIVVLFSNG